MNITNHRTERADFDLLLSNVSGIGDELSVNTTQRSWAGNGQRSDEPCRDLYLRLG